MKAEAKHKKCSQRNLSDWHKATSPLSSAILVGSGSDVVRTRFAHGSDVLSDMVQKVWQKLRERRSQHPEDVLEKFTLLLCRDWLRISKISAFKGAHRVPPGSSKVLLGGGFTPLM